jgi:hypothetical protein
VRHRTEVNCPSLALRPKLPATADQREVHESRPLCRNRLPTGYNAAQSDVFVETLFRDRRYRSEVTLVEWREDICVLEECTQDYILDILSRP